MYAKSVVLGLLFPQGVQMLGGSKCEHWFQDDGVSRIHIFIDSVTQGERQRDHVPNETRSRKKCIHTKVQNARLQTRACLRNSINVRRLVSVFCGGLTAHTRSAHAHRSSQAADGRDSECGCCRCASHDLRSPGFQSRPPGASLSAPTLKDYVFKTEENRHQQVFPSKAERLLCTLPIT